MSVSDYLRLFLDRRMAIVFLLGFASGFPWVLFGSTMTAWLVEAGLSRTKIGVFGIIAVVYAINFLWAPLLDRLRLPWLGRRLGQRRSWILLMLGLIALATLGISYTNPAASLLLTSVLALVIVFASATQDIAIDAYRIEIISHDESRKFAAASAMATAGWWSGFGVPGAIALAMSDLPGVAWGDVYRMLLLFLLALMLFVRFIPEPRSEREAQQRKDEADYRAALGDRRDTRATRAAAWLAVTVVQPFVEFFRRNGVSLAVAILSFVLLFKIGEAFIGKMSLVFYKELGFSNTQIAAVSKLVGWSSFLVFSLLGGLINVRFGLFKGLMIGGVAMASTNLMFAVLAKVGPDMQLFTLAIVLDNFTTALSTVTFVAFISHLTSRVYTATQYALLASLGNLGRTTLAAGSGLMVDSLGGDWATFFVLTTLMVVPSLILLLWIRQALTQRLGQAFGRNREPEKAV